MIQKPTLKTYSNVKVKFGDLGETYIELTTNENTVTVEFSPDQWSKLFVLMHEVTPCEHLAQAKRRKLVKGSTAKITKLPKK